MEPTSNKEPNEYALLNLKREFSTPNDKEGTLTFQTISFYEMNEDGTFKNGTTIEEVLRVASERLEALHGRFPSDYNVNARKHIEAAIGELNARTQDRINRGVEG